MSSFDVTVLTAPPDMGWANEEQRDRLEIVVPVVLPIGEGQAMHLGTVRFGLDQPTAKGFFEKGLELVEEMTPPSNIAVASSMSQAEQTAKDFDGLK